MLVCTHHTSRLIQVQYSPEFSSSQGLHSTDGTSFVEPMGVGRDYKGEFIESLSPTYHQALQPWSSEEEELPAQA